MNCSAGVYRGGSTQSERDGQPFVRHFHAMEDTCSGGYKVGVTAPDRFMPPSPISAVSP